MKNTENKYEEAVHDLLTKIFTGRLQPGDKLPPRKQLMDELMVGGTTLQAALKLLESMHLLEIMQDGEIYARDYLKHAGIDFLRLLFTGEEDRKTGVVIDHFIIDEVWEFWMTFLPEVVKMAAQKFSPRDLNSLKEMLTDEKNHISQKDKVVEMELAQQDLTARTTGNIMVILLFNSSRPLIKKMLEIFYDAVSRRDLEEHIQLKIRMLRDFSGGSLRDAAAGIDQFTRQLRTFREMIRKSMVSREKKS